jgi:hypothetical protein
MIPITVFDTPISLRYTPTKVRIIPYPIAKKPIAKKSDDIGKIILLSAINEFLF